MTLLFNGIDYYLFISNKKYQSAVVIVSVFVYIIVTYHLGINRILITKQSIDYQRLQY